MQLVVSRLGAFNKLPNNSFTACNYACIQQDAFSRF